MTIIKGKPDKNGNFRRYFNCTGRSHKKSCSGPKCTIYAEDLEQMVYDCISGKLAVLMNEKHTAKMEDTAEVNDLKLKIKAIEQSEKQLTDSILSGNLNTDMIELINQRASQLKEEKLSLHERLDEIRSTKKDIGSLIDLAHSWKRANYERKKAVAMILIHQILIVEDGSTKVIWKI